SAVASAEPSAASAAPAASPEDSLPSEESAPSEDSAGVGCSVLSEGSAVCDDPEAADGCVPAADAVASASVRWSARSAESVASASDSAPAPLPVRAEEEASFP